MSDPRKFLIWPWDDWRAVVDDVPHMIAHCLKPLTNHILIDMTTRKYDEVKQGEAFTNKREQSLEYIIRHWPKDHPRRTVVQAGGCLGMWPKVLSYYFDTVYTFEAQSEAFYFLSLNCPERNIIKSQMALGNKTGGFIDIPMTNRPGQGKVQKGGKVPVIALDTLNIQDCDALLLDVEGFEPLVLQGAQKLIERCKPYILCEDNWNSMEVQSILECYGYEVITKANKDRIFKHKSKPWPGGQWDKYTMGDTPK